MGGLAIVECLVGAAYLVILVLAFQDIVGRVAGLDLMAWLLHPGGRGYRVGLVLLVTAEFPAIAEYRDTQVRGLADILEAGFQGTAGSLDGREFQDGAV